MRTPILIAFALVAVGLASSASARPTAPRLAGVDLRRLSILGTEPFWSIDVMPGRIEIQFPDDSKMIAPNPGPRLAGGKATWRTRSRDGIAVLIVLEPGPCSDGMSDVNYPLKATIRVGQGDLKGCAEPPQRH
jgi:uncharacterized membrane protein